MKRNGPPKRAGKGLECPNQDPRCGFGRGGWRKEGVFLEGEGFFGDLVEKFFPTRQNFPPKVRDIIKEYAAQTITGIVVGRRPIPNYVSKALDFISQGRLGGQQKKLNYDDLYHLFLLVSLGNGVTLLVEKNAVVNMERVSNHYPSQASMNAGLFDRQIFFGDFINKAVQKVGPSIYLYDAVSNNCQVFVLELLNSSGLLTPNLHSFILQDIKTVLNESPAYTSALAKFFTETHAKLDRVIHGAAIKPWR